jgi:prepilin-type N-terminal cleavage/methylation domain-containing protein
MGVFKGHRIGASDGFTLVELAVTVGIAGTIAAMTIPSYMRFQRSTRQNEARTALAAMYTVEKNYALEFQTYTMCLQDIGYSPPPGPRYYARGFAPTVETRCGPDAEGGSAEPCNRTHWAADGTIKTCVGATGWGATVKGAGLGAPSGIPNQSSLGPGTYVAQKWFSARAVGNIGGVTSPTATTTYDGWSEIATPYDAWSIDQSKKMLNFQPGL